MIHLEPAAQRLFRSQPLPFFISSQPAHQVNGQPVTQGTGSGVEPASMLARHEVLDRRLADWRVWFAIDQAACELTTDSR